MFEETFATLLAVAGILYAAVPLHSAGIVPPEVIVAEAVISATAILFGTAVAAKRPLRALRRR